MESYDLRSEIYAMGQTYHIQTTIVPSKRTIVTSLFHEGSLLSKQVEGFDSSLTQDEVRRLARDVHDEKKSGINSLLAIKEKLTRTDDARAHLRLSEALFHQSLYREAMAEVVLAVKLGVEESRAFSILGNALAAIGEYDKAVKAFKKGLEISPDYPDLYNDLGNAYLTIKHCGKAVRAFERAVELNRYYDEALLNLAVALCLNVMEMDEFELSQGLRQRLRSVFGRILELKPSLDTEDFQEARLAVEEERYDLAHAILCKIREGESPLTGEQLSLELYLVLKFHSEDLSESDIDIYIDRVTKELESNPGYADLQNDLGLLYAAKCKLYIDKAREAFEESLQLNRSYRKAEKNLRLTENDGQGIDHLLRALLD